MQKILSDPGKIYAVHTKTSATISYVTRSATLQEGDFENVNHIALAFQAPDGQVYVIDIVDFREPSSSTNVRVKRLEDWAAPYTDIQAQALPISEARASDLLKYLGTDRVDFETMRPIGELRFDRAGAILGAGVGLPIGPQPNVQTICSNMVCDIIHQGIGIAIPEIPENRYVSPNDLRHGIDVWIRQGQSQQ